MWIPETGRADLIDPRDHGNLRLNQGAQPVGEKRPPSSLPNSGMASQKNCEKGVSIPRICRRIRESIGKLYRAAPPT